MTPVMIGTQHITPADGNVFLDLGFPPDEAARLLAEARLRVEAKLLATEEARRRQKDASASAENRMAEG
jgi:hypothetical protein